MEILTRTEAGEYLKMPVRTIDYLVQTDQIPFYRPTKRNVRFSKDDLDAWLKTRKNIEFRQNRKKKS